MFIPTFMTPSQINSLERGLIDTFEYRLHIIHLKDGGNASTAEIYDGARKVFETHGTDREQALREAEQWIDEQDEVTPINDLHQHA